MSNGDPDDSPDEPAPDNSASESDATAGATEGPDSAADPEPVGSADPEASDRHDPASEDAAPLSDLASRMDRQRRDRGDGDPADSTPDFDPELSDDPPPDPDDDPFDRMPVGEIDEETLWSSLGSDSAAGAGVDVDTDAGTGSLSDVEPASGVESVGDTGSEAREHVVPKDTYCQSCPYLDGPPELACTHDGTEIVEVVDSDRFRVRNCPMVEGGGSTE